MFEIIFLLLGIVAMPFGFALLRMLRQMLAGLLSRKEQEQDHLKVARPRAVITLVHGTFAKGAPWTRPGSRLAKALTAHFGDDCQLQYQDWSGFNAFASRSKGAALVAEKIAASRREHSEVPHYLIGHSHGGNVALLAALSDGSAPLDGIVCLATPVLTTKRK